MSASCFVLFLTLLLSLSLYSATFSFYFSSNIPFKFSKFREYMLGWPEHNCFSPSHLSSEVIKFTFSLKVSQIFKQLSLCYLLIFLMTILLFLTLQMLRLIIKVLPDMGFKFFLLLRTNIGYMINFWKISTLSVYEL